MFPNILENKHLLQKKGLTYQLHHCPLDFGVDLTQQYKYNINYNVAISMQIYDI